MCLAFARESGPGPTCVGVSSRPHLDGIIEPDSQSWEGRVGSLLCHDFYRARLFLVTDILKCRGDGSRKVRPTLLCTGRLSQSVRHLVLDVDTVAGVARSLGVPPAPPVCVAVISPLVDFVARSVRAIIQCGPWFEVRTLLRPDNHGRAYRQFDRRFQLPHRVLHNRVQQARRLARALVYRDGGLAQHLPHSIFPHLDPVSRQS
ncbi:hypothetical protein SprV_0802573700 [Sparganum proliferum]